MQQPEAGAIVEANSEKEEKLPCPRCNSSNTRFCYFNNYNITQPRHFCKGCRRYWTKGGMLRDIPIGGGYPKGSKRRREAFYSSSNNHPITHRCAPSSAFSQPQPQPQPIFFLEHAYRTRDASSVLSFRGSFMEKLCEELQTDICLFQADPGLAVHTVSNSREQTSLEFELLNIPNNGVSTALPLKDLSHYSSNGCCDICNSCREALRK